VDPFRQTWRAADFKATPEQYGLLSILSREVNCVPIAIKELKLPRMPSVGLMPVDLDQNRNTERRRSWASD